MDPLDVKIFLTWTPGCQDFLDMDPLYVKIFLTWTPVCQDFLDMDPWMSRFPWGLSADSQARAAIKSCACCIVLMDMCGVGLAIVTIHTPTTTLFVGLLQ